MAAEHEQSSALGRSLTTSPSLLCTGAFSRQETEEFKAA
eukprot:CAMPEP_0185210824 /NCGR_PEP_ID=MMETSP1140-20130426/66367_1 /TAXON_ID=298111 /ORGANISM="Pavlova sp., Strain CCMP459" /LENGTH=38 /DNA_ID= /DNA_START= /DNA_END= /DNA_ORIENTATION=